MFAFKVEGPCYWAGSGHCSGRFAASEPATEDCDVATAAGSPVAGSGSPKVAPGSPGLVAIASSGSGSGDGMSLSEPAICVHCETMEHA